MVAAGCSCFPKARPEPSIHLDGDRSSPRGAVAVAAIRSLRFQSMRTHRVGPPPLARDVVARDCLARLHHRRGRLACFRRCCTRRVFFPSLTHSLTLTPLSVMSTRTSLAPSSSLGSLVGGRGGAHDGACAAQVTRGRASAVAASAVAAAVASAARAAAAATRPCRSRSTRPRSAARTVARCARFPCARSSSGGRTGRLR